MGAWFFFKRNMENLMCCLFCCCGWCANMCWGYEMAPIDYQDPKRFFDKWLNVIPAISMSSIIWKNIGYTKKNRMIRSTIIWIIAGLMIFCALLIMVAFKDYGDGLKAAAPTSQCPKFNITIEDAYSDSLRVPKQRNNQLSCFCKGYYNENAYSVEGTLDLFLEQDATLTESPCVEWLFAYENNLYLVAMAGIIIGLVNTVCVVIFEIIVIFEKCKTYMD